MKVLLGVTGSVGTTNIKHLISDLQADKHEVKVVATKNAMYFLRGQFPLGVDFWADERERPGNKYEIGQPIGYIELRTWADVLVVAPLSANTLAKFANGLCDNLLTNVFRAWDFNKPVILAPAMEQMMWESPFTRNHLYSLTEFRRSNDKPSVEVIPPVFMELACEDESMGAMAETCYIARLISALETK